MATYTGTDVGDTISGVFHEVQLANKTFVEGDNDGNGKADFQIELTGHLDLVKGDFVL